MILVKFASKDMRIRRRGDNLAASDCQYFTMRNFVFYSFYTRESSPSKAIFCINPCWLQLREEDQPFSSLLSSTGYTNAFFSFFISFFSFRPAASWPRWVTKLRQRLPQIRTKNKKLSDSEMSYPGLEASHSQTERAGKS